MMVRMRAWRPGRSTVDVTVGVVAALVTASGTWDRVAPWLPHAVTVPLALGQGLLLLARRRAPTAVLAGTTAIGVFMIAVGFPNGDASFATCCAAYALAAHAQRGEPAELSATLRGAAATLAAGVALAAANTAPDARNRVTWGGVLGLLIYVALIVATWVLGYAISTRRDYVAELKDRAARLEAQEGERAARAVVDERLRIARELHDVVAHAMSVITVQAGVARYIVSERPEQTSEALGAIESTGRQALRDMRQLLSVLRQSDEGTPHAPTPRLDDLGEVLSRTDAAGTVVELSIHGAVRPLPDGVELAAYRIVQEALTNVVKHAATDHARVVLDYEPDELAIEVVDDGIGAAADVRMIAAGAGAGAGAASIADAAVVDGGHGLVGMRERAAMHGGTLEAGPLPVRGYRVAARLPLPSGMTRPQEQAQAQERGREQHGQEQYGQVQRHHTQQREREQNLAAAS